MADIKQRDLRPLPDHFPLEEVILNDNVYRRLKAQFDLSFVRDLVAPSYAEGGKSSMD